MTDVKFLLLYSNSSNNLSVYKQTRKSKWTYSYWIEVKKNFFLFIFYFDFV